MDARATGPAPPSTCPGHPPSTCPARRTSSCPATDSAAARAADSAAGPAALRAYHHDHDVVSGGQFREYATNWACCIEMVNTYSCVFTFYDVVKADTFVFLTTVFLISAAILTTAVTTGHDEQFGTYKPCVQGKSPSTYAER